MAANLMIHSGASRVDREQVRRAPTPARTRTWVPIPHHHLLSQVERTLEGHGFQITDQSHALWGDNAERYFALLEVRSGVSNSDYGLIVGLRNTHDRTYPAGLALGSRVLVCSNLSFVGEITLTRRHTRYIERDLPQIVNRAIGKLSDLRGKQDQRIERYKQSELSHQAAHDIVIRSVDARIIPVTKVPAVLTEWRKPRHSEFTADGWSAWRLFNGFTEIMKGSNLCTLPKRTEALSGLIDSSSGIAV